MVLKSGYNGSSVKAKRQWRNKFIIDTNCLLGHSNLVKKHTQAELENKYPGEAKKKLPKELKDLDGE